MYLEDKRNDLARTSGRGAFILFVGNVSSNVIAALSSILVARLLGSTAFGSTGIAVIPASIIGLFSDLGITPAMTRFAAQHNSQGQLDEARVYVEAGMLMQFLLGLILSLGAFLSSSFLSQNIFQKPDLIPLVSVASFMILFNSMTTASQASFIAFSRTGYYSLTMILQSLMKIVLAPLLVLLGYGALGAVTGNTISLLISASCGLVFVYLFLLQPSLHEHKSTGLGTHLKAMLTYGFPLFISVLLSGALTQIYNFLMALYCSEFLIGNLLVATKFSVLIGFFTMPISTVLFPAFSQLDKNRNKEQLRSVFQSSVKYTALVALPVISALIALSQPIIGFLFGAGYEPACLFLVLYSFSNVFVGLGGLSIWNLLNGQGYTRVTLMLNAVTLIVGVPLSLYLIPTYQIVGLLTCMIIANMPFPLLGIWWIKRALGFSIDFKSSAKLYATALVSGFATYLILPILGPGDLKDIVIGGAIFLVLYSIFLLVTRAVDRTDITNLRELLAGLGPLTGLFDHLLSIADKVLMLISRS